LFLPHSPLPHPIFREEGVDVCLIVKDPEEEHIEAVKGSGAPGLARIISVGRLKKEFKSYEQKRGLCSQYDLFLADNRVVETLNHTLGKAFFQKKKYV